MQEQSKKKLISNMQTQGNVLKTFAIGWPEPELVWYQVNEGGGWDAITNDDKHTINILLNHANVLSQWPSH